MFHITNTNIKKITSRMFHSTSHSMTYTITKYNFIRMFLNRRSDKTLVPRSYLYMSDRTLVPRSCLYMSDRTLVPTSCLYRSDRTMLAHYVTKGRWTKRVPRFNYLIKHTSIHKFVNPINDWWHVIPIENLKLIKYWIQKHTTNIRNWCQFIRTFLWVFNSKIIKVFVLKLIETIPMEQSYHTVGMSTFLISNDGNYCQVSTCMVLLCYS